MPGAKLSWTRRPSQLRFAKEREKATWGGESYGKAAAAALTRRDEAVRLKCAGPAVNEWMCGEMCAIRSLTGFFSLRMLACLALGISNGIFT